MHMTPQVLVNVMLYMLIRRLESFYTQSMEERLKFYFGKSVENSVFVRKHEIFDVKSGSE